MDLKKHIGLKVKTARKRKGWTQEQLASRLHKAVETISHIERGAVFTGIETLEKLAKLVGEPLVYFFEGAERAKSLNATQAEAQQKAKQLIELLSSTQLAPVIAMLESLSKQDRKPKSGG
ncbi:MAG: helix-turn-helix transcriptional regulator [Fimbriimonadaceae bacterium]